MKKIGFLMVTSLLCLCLLVGCVGTPVVIGGDCTCSTMNPAPTDPVEGAVKTGVAVFTTVSDSTSAADGAEGAVKYDVTIAAVTVDDGGVIRGCTIDSIPATVKIGADGTILSDISAAVPTKNELGADYGMVAWGGAKAEWNEQVAALCRYAEGKTVAQLKNGAIDESGKAPANSDLASSATIYLGGFVSAIEAAVNNAAHLGAMNGDVLKLVTLNKVSASTAASAEKDGTAQLDADIAVVTVNNGVITSCIIDSVQAKINFNATGTITSDLSAAVLTKNELGENYGMVAWGGAKAEWNKQAAAFASYVTGKNAEQVAGIAVSETTKPADGSDLASSVTIAIGGFQALIAKAFGA